MKYSRFQISLTCHGFFPGKTEDTTSSSTISFGLIVAINVGIVILIVCIVIICIKFIILPRRKKRQRAAHHAHNGAIAMTNVTDSSNQRQSQLVGEPIKPPSYEKTIQEISSGPEIPSVTRVVPSAPPPTYTFALRDPPNRTSAIGLYPELPVDNTS